MKGKDKSVASRGKRRWRDLTDGGKHGLLDIYSCYCYVYFHYIFILPFHEVGEREKVWSVSCLNWNKKSQRIIIWEKFSDISNKWNIKNLTYCMCYAIYKWIWRHYTNTRASLIAQSVNNLPAIQETQVRFLGQKDPLEKEMAIHFSILAWKIPWTEEHGRL